MMQYNPYFIPGFVELFVGPMKCGKTKALFDRIDKLKYMNGIEFVVVRPDIDTRSHGLRSRYLDTEHEALVVPRDNPQEVYRMISEYAPNAKVIAYDELQFFSGLDELIDFYASQGKHQVGAGLNLDFRGISFGDMATLIPKADTAEYMNAICDYPGCNNLSSRTQRLIDGEPAPFDSPIVLVEGSGKETYETRCREHHFVPGKPKHYHFD